MALDRVGALKRERESLLAFCRSLGDEEWAAPSKCPGWSVKDVVGHMAALAHGVFTPWMIKFMRAKDVERANDSDVELRRIRPPAEVLGEYEKWSRRLAAVLPAAQRRPLARVPLKLGNLGSYPMALIPSSLAFDTHTHLRHDIAPAVDRPAPDSDPQRMEAVVEWMLTALPQMCRRALSAMDRPLALTLEGPGGGSWTITPRPGELVEVSPGRSGEEAAHITGQATELPVWGTGRAPWRDAGLKLEGDEGYAARFLDGVRIF